MPGSLNFVPFSPIPFLIYNVLPRKRKETSDSLHVSNGARYIYQISIARPYKVRLLWVLQCLDVVFKGRYGNLNKGTYTPRRAESMRLYRGRLLAKASVFDKLMALMDRNDAVLPEAEKVSFLKSLDVIETKVVATWLAEH